MSRERFGATHEIDAFDVRTVARAQDPRWFDGWRTGSLRVIATQDLDAAALAELDAAEQVHLVSIEVAAPADLAYLQTAWALARWLVARGGAIVLDAHAMTFRAGAALPAADAPLDVAREVRRVFETSSTRADLAHALHTRGMRKFGAPDIVALCTDADARFVASAMGQLANAVARGVDIATPRFEVELVPGLRWYLVDDEHRLGELLQLNNAARVLVDEQGRDLMGVLGRLPRGTG